MAHARAGEPCERSASLAAAMGCCRQAAVEKLAPAPSGLRTGERLIDAPTPTGQIVDAGAPPAAAAGRTGSTPTATPRRSPPDVCALLSVFRI